MGGDRPLDLTLNCMCMYMHLHMCMLQVSFYNIERVGFLGGCIISLAAKQIVCEFLIAEHKLSSSHHG